MKGRKKHQKKYMQKGQKTNTKKGKKYKGQKTNTRKNTYKGQKTNTKKLGKHIKGRKQILGKKGKTYIKGRAQKLGTYITCSFLQTLQKIDEKLIS